MIHDEVIRLGPENPDKDPLCRFKVEVRGWANGDVTIRVLYREASIEDKRYCTFIEKRIREGFEQYHKDKNKNSIDI